MQSEDTDQKGLESNLNFENLTKILYQKNVTGSKNIECQSPVEEGNLPLVSSSPGQGWPSLIS